MTRIERYKERSDLFADEVATLLLRAEFEGVSLSKFSRWIKDMICSPLDDFNLFLLSEGYVNSHATVKTERTMEGYYTSYPAMIYKNKLIDLDIYNNFMSTGMRRGYVIKFSVCSNGKVLQNRYLSEVDVDDVAQFCVNPEIAYPFECLEEAKSTLENLLDYTYIQEMYMRPSIIELHEKPFKDREILLKAFL